MNTATELNQPEVSLKSMLSHLSEAAQHPHLIKYDIKSNGALIGANNDLYIPLVNSDGKLVTAQRIAPDGTTELMEGKPTTGGFHSILGEDTVVLLAKSHQAASVLFEATGYTTIMYVSHDNLRVIIDDLKEHYSTTPIMMCCDQEDELDKEVAISHGVTVVQPEVKDGGRIINFQQSNGRPKLKALVDSMIEQANLRIPEGYELTPHGLFFFKPGKDGVSRRQKVCENLKVTSLLRDKEADNWGLVVEVKDPDDNFHEVILKRTHLTGAHSKYLDMLVPKGLLAEVKMYPELRNYLQKVKPISRATSVTEPGWFGDQYVFPNVVIGDGPDRLIFQSEDEPMCDTTEIGSLMEWRRNVAKPCQGNSRLLLALSAAFSPIIKNFTGSENTGLHFNGSSSCGKTTLLELAKSVWGNPHHLPRWKATDNGLEVLASHHNDSLLVLDEIAQLSPKDVGDAVYMLGNGKGKQRMTGRKRPASWRTTLLSTGEVSLEQHMTKAKANVTAGQEVRFINVYAPVSEEMGVFDTTHDYADGREFSDALKVSAKRYHGVAAKRAIKLVTEHRDMADKFIKEVKRDFMKQANLEGAVGQVYRVAGHLAEIAAAGELATQMRITGWDKGEAFDATLRIFNEWLDNRGTSGSLEDQKMLDAIRERLSSRGDMWFHTEDKNAARNGKCYGIKDDEMFYVEISAFQTIFCQDFDYKVAANMLLRKGFLVPQNDGKLTKNKSVNKQSKRFYHIRSTILADQE
ncbi:TOPRIM and DUF927 domain-containing protein [Vibrio diazotrophicus]|uniref:TOPRIM and DUF927 domain-containing protein n=1 Tax=Vibrio diazotrophicus TaxID=685 RepID=UPI0005A6EC2D|nr:DUF927 domain-containing protein [Vibrio diazotrophicus]